MDTVYGVASHLFVTSQDSVSKADENDEPTRRLEKIAVARRQFVASFEDGAIEVIPIVPSGKTVEYIYYRTRRLLLVLCSVEETAASLWKTSAQRSSAQIT